MRSCDLRSGTIAIFTLGLLLSIPAFAEGGGVRVHNGTSTTVTVNSENGYGCTADAGDTCSFVVAVGKHTFNAKRHDTGKTRTDNVEVKADGYDMQLSDGAP